MNKISKRLLSIADFISSKDELVDIGCDHALLPIYLIQNKLCTRAIATDINKNALNNAINNIKDANLNIETVLSDGLNKVNLTNINTIVISGMGTTTIIDIPNDENKLKNIDKIIIQSNNEHSRLREYLNSINYYLDNEINLKERNKWYTTMLFIKSSKKNTLNEIEYGLLNNTEYNDYLLKEYQTLLSLIPKTNNQYDITNTKYNNLLSILKEK